MAKRKPIVLFSTNTLLAYRINENYYGGKHFVWCNPFSNPKEVLPANTAMPPSSMFSEEYFIEELPREAFEIVQF